MTLNSVIFTYMFSSFYYHSYIRSKNTKNETNLKKKTDDAAISNGNVQYKSEASTQNGQTNADQYTETGLNRIKSSWYEQPTTESTAATNILNHRIPQTYDNVKIK
jgi:hypothetical protein